MASLPIPDPSQQQQTPNAQGISNPPNDPIVANGNTDPNAGVSSASDSTQPSASQTAPDPGQTQQTPAPAQQGPKQPNAAQSQTVSNAPAPDPNANHPSVQRAGVLRSVAQALAGGPRFQTSIDPATGATTRTQVPMSGRDLGFAIAMEALSGGIRGMSLTGPNATAEAGAAGFQQVSQEQQQAKQQQEQQAQQDLQNQTQALTRNAQIFEANSRAVLNIKQGERLGIKTMNEATANAADARDQAREAGQVAQENVGQDEALAEINGKFKGMTTLPQGWSMLNGKPQQNLMIIRDPSAKTGLTQAQYDKYAAANIPSFQKGTKISANAPQVSFAQLGIWDGQVQAHSQMMSEHNTVVDALQKSTDPATQALAKDVPDFNKIIADPQNGPTASYAIAKVQRYLHFSGDDGSDIADALHTMTANIPDPQHPGQFKPNPDAKYAQTIYGMYGAGDPAKGKLIMQRLTEENTPTPIKNREDANSKLSDPNSSPKTIQVANNFIARDDADNKLKQANALALHKAEKAETSALGVAALTPAEYGAIIDGIGNNQMDASQMLRYGKADQLKILADVKLKYPNYDTRQYAGTLGLEKWADSGKGGDQIQSLNTLLGHTKDFTDNMNALGNLSSSLVNTPINKLKSMTGNPQIVAFVGRMLAPRTEYMNLLNNNHALTVDDKASAATLLNENMSPSQMLAAMQQINGTANIRGAQTNARYKASFGKDMPNYHAPASDSGGSGATSGQGHTAQNVVPAGAIPGRNAAGQIVGYKTADGKTVRF